MLTIALDRRAQRRADARRAVKEDFTARRNVASAARAVHRALESEMRWRPLLHGKVKLALVDTLMVAVSEVGRDHPSVTRWMLWQWSEIDKLERQWLSSLWRRPITASQYGTAWAVAIGKLSATLTEWAADQVDDDWFDQQVNQELAAGGSYVVGPVE